MSTTIRAACVDIERYLDIPSPLTGDVEINLDGVDTIECGVTGEQAETSADTVETVTVDGGTLTLKSSNNVRYAFMTYFSLSANTPSTTTAEALLCRVLFHTIVPGTRACMCLRARYMKSLRLYKNILLPGAPTKKYVI